MLPDGVYESELERDGQLYYLRPEAPWALRSKTAEDMMATPVAGLEALVPVQGVRSLLAATTHNGFPVYASGEPRWVGLGVMAAAGPAVARGIRECGWVGVALQQPGRRGGQFHV